MSTFESLGLKPEILKALASLEFTTPTPIQSQAIPLIIDGTTDLVGLAQTGTGKTAAFGLPVLHQVDFSQKNTQALVICPTRELCNQITKDLQAFSKYINNANIVAVYGGASIEQQARSVRKGAQVVVATPGRLMDLMERKLVDISSVKFVVLDEADEMLNMGFQEDIDHILSFTPENKHVWLFSATMPKEVARIAKKYLHQPEEITVGTQNASAENIDHIYYTVKERDRYLALKRIIDFNPDIFGIIFCRTRHETQMVAENLMKDGYNCEPLHGDLSQGQRDSVMKKFKEKTLQLLCATDVAARGIDVNNVTHVINYNLPDDIENYTHRSGRTARAGKSGQSIVLISSREVGRIRDVERQIKTKFRAELVPNGKEICEKQLISLIGKVANVDVNEKAIEHYLPTVNEMMAHMTKEDVIKHFVSAEFNRFLDYYKNAQDLNATASARNNDRDRSGNGSNDANFTRLFINFGELDNINKGALVRHICDKGGVGSKDIGRIDIKREFSFVEVTNDKAETIVNAMLGTEIDGREVRIEISSAGGGSSRGGGSRGGYKGGNRGGGGYKGGERGGYKGGNDRSGGFKKKFGNDRGEKKSYSSEKSYGGEKKSYGGEKSFSGGGENKRKRNFYKPA